MKYQVIQVNPYKRSVVVAIGSHKEFKAWSEKYFNEKDDEDILDLIRESDGSSQAYFWFSSTGESIIEIPKFPRTPKEIAYCAHEALHAVFHILDYVNVDYEKDGANECFTYLLEYILSELLTFENYKTITV